MTTPPRPPAPRDHVPPEGAPALTDDERFEIVRRRDRSFDGKFVFSVRTTRIYCRPGCAARPARRENLAFHASWEAAERAGFRACRRCRPREVGLPTRQAQAVRRACRLIEVAETTPPSLAELARAAGLSPFHFHRVFRQITGVTPRAFASATRARRVAQRLRASNSVTEAIYDAGYNAASRFYEQAPARLGMAPSDYRRGGRGAEIRFAVGECSLGAVLVAATAQGVCAILLGNDPETLVRQLQDGFPRAVLKGGEPDFERTVARVVGLVEAPGTGLDLPLDIRGTAFQQRVWETLRAIPAGSTASYAEIAAAIGAPGAARAVARACAANRLAVAVPCHRVVRRDGGRSGYRWGIERGQVLAERERGPRRGDEA